MVLHFINRAHSPLSRNLLLTLASESPMCAAVHFPDLHLLLKLLSHNQEEEISPNLLCDLQFNIPFLYELFSTLQVVPNNLLLLLEEMTQRVRAPFNRTIAATVMPSSNQMSSRACYPALKQVRSRGVYLIDKKKATPICSKKATHHPALLPGIFTAYCPHGLYNICTILRFSD